MKKLLKATGVFWSLLTTPLKAIILVVFGLVALLIIEGSRIGGSSKPSKASQSSYDQFQSSSDPVDVLVKRCASEAGIPANNPNHAITPAEMRALTNCVDRNM